MRIEQERASGWGRLNPVTAVGNAWDRFSAHPIQGILSMIGGAVNPVIGRVMRMGFDRYNDSQFTGAMHQANDMTTQAGNRAEANAWGVPLDGVLGMFGGAPGASPGASSRPGAGLPQAAAPWWSTPGVVGGWIAPNGMMDFLGNPDQVITPDGTGVSLPIGQAPQTGAKPDWRTDVPRGAGIGEMGVMGRGANGEAFIRGMAPSGGNQRYFRNRRWM